MNETGEKTISPSARVDECITRVENGLITMTENDQPQWGSMATLAERMAHYRVPGVRIAMVDACTINWVKGYGVRVAGEVDLVTPHPLFHAGSLAKSLSAAATLTLVEQGLLNLDEDVNHNLVSWRVPENEYTREEKVTLRRLLSHSAGLEE